MNFGLIFVLILYISIVYSIRMKIRPKSIVYSIKMQYGFWPNFHSYTIRHGFRRILHRNTTDYRFGEEAEFIVLG